MASSTRLLVLSALVGVGSLGAIASRVLPFGGGPGSAFARGADPALRPPSASERVGSARELVAVNQRIAALRQAEAVTGQIDRAVLTPWRQSWASRDAAAFSRLFQAGAPGPASASAPRQTRREVEGVREQM